MCTGVDICECTRGGWGRGGIDTIRGSALKVDCGRKKPMLHWGIEPAWAACRSNAVPTEPRLCFMVYISGCAHGCVAGWTDGWFCRWMEKFYHTSQQLTITSGTRVEKTWTSAPGWNYQAPCHKDKFCVLVIAVLFNAQWTMVAVRKCRVKQEIQNHSKSLGFFGWHLFIMSICCAYVHAHIFLFVFLYLPPPFSVFLLFFSLFLSHFHPSPPSLPPSFPLSLSVSPSFSHSLSLSHSPLYLPLSPPPLLSLFLSPHDWFSLELCMT